MDCGYILYWVLFVCVLFGIVDIVMGMLFCNFCGPHCCCTAFCLAALFSLSSLVRLFLPCCGFSVFFGKWKNGFKLSLIKNGGVVFKYVLKFSELSCLWSMTDYGAFIAKVFYCLGWWYFFFLPPLLSNFFSNCDASICPWLPLRCNHFDNIAQHLSFFWTGLED